MQDLTPGHVTPGHVLSARVSYRGPSSSQRQTGEIAAEGLEAKRAHEGASRASGS